MHSLLPLLNTVLLEMPWQRPSNMNLQKNLRQLWTVHRSKSQPCIALNGVVKLYRSAKTKMLLYLALWYLSINISCVPLICFTHSFCLWYCKESVIFSLKAFHMKSIPHYNYKHWIRPGSPKLFHNHWTDT